MKRLSSLDIRKMKGQGLACLTAYTYPVAKAIDPYVDLILVGDSLGMVLYGLPTPHGVSMDMMLAHTQAVLRGSERAFIVMDLPFGAYQQSPQQAYAHAAQALAIGAQAVKLEGGLVMAETISFLVQRGIPVMGHVGMQPQSVHHYGSFGKRGKSPDQYESILADALAVQEAGALAVVLENIPENLADNITQKLGIPTVGIGAGKTCDGQILVTEDLCGYAVPPYPPFVTPQDQFLEKLQSLAQNYAQSLKI